MLNRELVTIAKLSPPKNAASPERVVELLRAVQEQIPEVAPLYPEEREALRRHMRFPDHAIQGSINAIGASGHLSDVLGVTDEEAQQLIAETNRWTAVISELRKMLNGVDGANLIRRQRAMLLADQAYNIARQLVRDPQHAQLRPHVDNIKHLRALHRRRKRGTEPEPEEGAPPAPE